MVFVTYLISSKNRKMKADEPKNIHTVRRTWDSPNPLKNARICFRFQTQYNVIAERD